MTANISFNEAVLVQSITDATVSVMQLTKVLETMRIELTDVAGSLNTFNNGLNESLSQSLKDTASNGITMVTILSAVSESVSFLANTFTILSSSAQAYEVITKIISKSSEMLTSIFLALKKKIAALIISTQLYTTSIVGGTAVTNVLTIATGLLKMAMDALPFIAIAALIALVVVGIIALIKHFTKASETQQRLNADTQALKESTDALNKSLEESKAAYAASTSKIQTNAGAAEILAEKIYVLSDEENKSAEAKRQLSVLVDQLNSTMPGLNPLYDEETDCLSQTAEQEVIWMAA